MPRVRKRRLSILPSVPRVSGRNGAKRVTNSVRSGF